MSLHGQGSSTAQRSSELYNLLPADTPLCLMLCGWLQMAADANTRTNCTTHCLCLAFFVHTSPHAHILAAVQVQAVLDAMPSSTLKPEDESAELDHRRTYRTTYMFSATMPPAVERLARKYLRRWDQYRASEGEGTVQGLQQVVWGFRVCGAVQHAQPFRSDRGRQNTMPAGKLVLFSECVWHRLWSGLARFASLGNLPPAALVLPLLPSH